MRTINICGGKCIACAYAVIHAVFYPIFDIDADITYGVHGVYYLYLRSTRERSSL